MRGLVKADLSVAVAGVAAGTTRSPSSPAVPSDWLS
jgi:hypothetical protein